MTHITATVEIAERDAVILNVALDLYKDHYPATYRRNSMHIDQMSSVLDYLSGSMSRARITLQTPRVLTAVPAGFDGDDAA